MRRQRNGRSKLRALSRICGVGLLLGGTAFVACGGTVTTEHNGSGGSGGGSGKCGNGVIDDGEVCDVKLGGQTCSTATAGSRTSGTLKCSASCTFDISACTSGGSSGVGGSSGMGVGGGAGMAGMGGISGGPAVGGSAGMGGSAGQPPIYNSCSTGDACVLVPTNCCGYCSQQPLGMFTAVNARYASDYQATFCGTQVACPPCALYAEPDYTAVCRNGVCEAVDVSSDSLSSCATSSDCTLRWGAECCERCSGDGLTAVRASGFDSEVCGGFFGCPDCAIPAYPTSARAACTTDGHCIVQMPMP